MNPMERLAECAEPLTRHPYILRVRRNHGLEHATIHLLNRQNYQLSGRSSDSGFILLGDVPTDKVESAVQEAITRMKAGEHKLAIHPNCGTNLVTTGFLATAVGFSRFRRARTASKLGTLSHDGGCDDGGHTVIDAAGHELAALLHHRGRSGRYGTGQRPARNEDHAIQRSASDAAPYRDGARIGAP